MGVESKYEFENIELEDGVNITSFGDSVLGDEEEEEHGGVRDGVESCVKFDVHLGGVVDMVCVLARLRVEIDERGEGRGEF